MSHISTRSPGTLCYRCGGCENNEEEMHPHFVTVSAIVINQGVFIAEITHRSDDGVNFTEQEGSSDIMRPISDLIWYESDVPS